MSRGWIDINRVEKLLTDAYNALSNISVEDCEDWQLEDAMGCIAEALARVQGDAGSFDIEGRV